MSKLECFYSTKALAQQFRLPTDQWYWSLKYDGIRVGLHATGFGTTQHGLQT
jgi:hypothetical protein